MYYEVTSPFGQYNIGDLFYSRFLDGRGLSEHPHYQKEVYLDKVADNFLPVPKDKVQTAYKSYSQVMAQPITRQDPGVQDEDDWFSMFPKTEAFGFNWDKYDAFQNTFQTHYFKDWMCTDTLVGIGVICLQGQPIAFFSQSGRKSDCHYKFITQAKYEMAREVMEEEFTLTPKFDNTSDFVVENDNLINFWVSDKA